MTKSKKHSRPTLEEALAQPWCYYCEKVCTDVGALLSHQKDKHFQCPCRRRLNTAGGLKVHMAQVHKEELKEVPNALPHRKDPSIEVFTTVGIPEDVLRQHQHDVTAEFSKQEYDHRVRTGNPAPGTAQQPAAKKQKVESTESLKSRVAEYRAKRAARKAQAEAEAAAGNPVPSTASPLEVPTPTAVSPAPANGAHPFTFNAGPNVFGAQPIPPPGQASFSSSGASYPAQHIPSPISTTAVVGPPPTITPVPSPYGQFQPPTAISHPLPPGPTARSPQNGPTQTPAAGHQIDQASSHTTYTHKPAESLQGVSLVKLCKHGLDAVKAASKDGGDRIVGTDDNGLTFKPVDLFVAICNGVYGLPVVSSKLLSKAEDVLRGLLKVGADSALPAGFQHTDKVSPLKGSIAVAPAPTDQDADPKTKKKNVEVRKLRRDSVSWEEEFSLRHETGDHPPTSSQTTGPAGDAVTGVVGDGDVGSTVMEE